MRIDFNNIEDYLSEMELDRGLIERNIIRCVVQRNQGRIPSLITVKVISTYGVCDETGIRTVVRFDKFIGEYATGDSDQPERLRLQAVELSDRISKAAAKAGLEVRGGVATQEE